MKGVNNIKQNVHLHSTMQKYQFVQRRPSGSVSQLLFQGVFLRSKHILTTHCAINKTLQCVVRIQVVCWICDRSLADTRET